MSMFDWLCLGWVLGMFVLLACVWLDADADR